MQSGELIVTGFNNIVIPLNRPIYPSEVRVHFKDNGPAAVPCDPGSADTLTFEVTANSVGLYVLFISWSVSSVREIAWHVAY